MLKPYILCSVIVSCVVVVSVAVAAHYITNRIMPRNLELNTRGIIIEELSLKCDSLKQELDGKAK